MGAANPKEDGSRGSAEPHLNRIESVVTTSLVAVVVLLMAGCSGRHDPGHATAVNLPVAQVRVQAAESKRQAVTEEVVGTVRAKLHATLEAKVSGRIEKMPVVLGQKVKAGELVARLDAVEIKARLDQAQAAREQADRDWNRISSLYKGQAVTRSEYDTAEARRRVAQAGVAEAEAMMRYLEVMAPFDGVVSRKWVDVGDLASPGKPLIEVEDPSTLQLEADIPEAVSAQIQPGAPLSVRLDSIKTLITGKVAEIAPAADPASRTVSIKLDLPQAPGVMPGQFARLLVPVGESNNLEVPASAVVQRGQLEMVFVVKDQHALLHLVKTGKRTDRQVEILSGVDAGDSVAIESAALLADGQPVEVK